MEPAAQRNSTRYRSGDPGSEQHGGARMHGVDPAGEVMSGDDHLGRAHTPFEQPWWLDAVAPGSWGEVVVERQGEPVARLPYVRKRKLGLTVLTQPPLTRFVGPW